MRITTTKTFKLGIILIITSLLLGCIVFGPIIYQESKYQINNAFTESTESVVVEPINKGFTLVIPKIGAEADIISDVDPYNPSEYLQALTKGVAHAKGTAKPGENGNIFLFAHSSDNFYNANRYNSVFYLLYKLEVGDDIYLTNNNELFTYKVMEKQTIEPEEIEYISNRGDKNELTLMTCWPPGTTNRRLLIKAY